ncbi:carboxymuconolactone decarboxylase family protein [Paraglaciecola sp.]|uniref:carboxymuconolactone decarboxylase family protein n=1 Tax=Paraglaciecola sp. TaxID=1920173 RepID=UPI003EF8AF29
MNHFAYHNLDTAPSGSVEVLASVEQKLECIPNIFAVIAESPSALKGLAELNQAFSHSTFSPEEQQIILLATSTTNECVYCVAGHTAFAQNLDITPNDLTALRNKQNTSNSRFNTLVNTVQQLIQHRGRITRSCMRDFLLADFSQAQFMELVLGVCVKTFTNYVSNALSVELDEQFKPFAWARPSDIESLTA